MACQESAATLMGKKQPKSPFQGLWHIVSMSGCEDYFNEEVRTMSLTCQPLRLYHFLQTGVAIAVK